MDLVTPALSGSELARRHIDDCKQHLQKGDASSAMHCLLQAVCQNGGAAGASDAQKLRSTFLERVKTTNDIHALLSRLDLSDSAPRCRDADGMSAAPSAASSMSSSMHASTHVHASRGHILGSDYIDSSSFLCEACGGVFARDRQEQHYRQWCPALRHIADEGVDHDSDSGSDMVS